MKLATFVPISFLAVVLAGCGSGSSGGSGGGGGGTVSLGYLFGERLGADVYMQPGPPAFTFPTWTGSAPAIRIDQVVQFASTVNPNGATIYEATTQVVFGQVTGSTAGKQVVLYSYTNGYYIQPLTSTTINISGNSTWIAPANPGQVSALLVAQGYSAPATAATLPHVDGVNVFAVSTTNSSQFSFSQYAVPTAGSGLSAIVAGPDGALWFCESLGNKIGRITTSGTMTEFPLHLANSSPADIVPGPDGALWFTESNANQIGRITTAGTITEFPVPTLSAGAGRMTLGPDGALWFVEYYANNIGRITTSGAVTEYRVTTAGSGPEDIASGPDGALWFTEATAKKIGRITTAGQITEYPVTPLPGAQGYIATPLAILAGADGNLWFDEAPAGLATITTSGTITQSNQAVGDFTVGPDGAIWYIDFNGTGAVLGQINLSGVISSYVFPPINSASTQGFEITSGPDGALWFTDYTPNLIGRFGPN
jgi:virginiamycin B lyase